MERLVNFRRRPSSVVAGNDVTAMDAFVKAEEAGIRVPDGIAIVRYDDISAARLLRGALTAAALRPEHIGSGVMELMLERLTGGADAERRSEFLPFELVIRDSAWIRTSRA